MVEPGGIEPPTSCMPCKPRVQQRETKCNANAQDPVIFSTSSDAWRCIKYAFDCSRNVATVRPPKPVIRLTSTRVEALRPAKDRYEVGDTEVRGLQLRVTPTGMKILALALTTGRANRCAVLGPWPKVAIGAHEQAAAARELLRKGIDPRRSGLTRATRVKAEAPPPVSSVIPSLTSPESSWPGTSAVSVNGQSTFSAS